MVEIYNYDITTHDRFARDQQAVEAFRRQYHIPRSGERSIAVQTIILDFVPKPAALILFLQLDQKKLWALVAVPPDYYGQRLTSSYVAPSLGPQEKQEADIQKIHALLKQMSNQDEVMAQGAIITSLLQNIKHTNDMVDFVIARMHQFIQA